MKQTSLSYFSMVCDRFCIPIYKSFFHSTDHLNVRVKYIYRQFFFFIIYFEKCRKSASECVRTANVDRSRYSRKKINQRRSYTSYNSFILNAFHIMKNTILKHQKLINNFFQCLFWLPLIV